MNARNAGNRHNTGFHRPFENLHHILKQFRRRSMNRLQAPAIRVRDRARRRIQEPISEAIEHALFEAAMAGVVPIDRNTHSGDGPPDIPAPCFDPEIDKDVVKHLQDLVESGAGFIVCDTPEYMEGRAADVSPEVLKKLHAGEYAVQAHMDLHGLTSPEAESAFHAFMADAIRRNRNAVLVIHGRGLSSPGQPVLKNKVFRWLTSRHWQRWVIGFTSARPCDGGAGATYVLLRDRPARIRRSAKKPGHFSCPQA